MKQIWPLANYNEPERDNANFLINPLKTRNSKMGTMANSADPDEMPHNAALNQGLRCLLKQNRSSEYEIHIQYCF